MQHGGVGFDPRHLDTFINYTEVATGCLSPDSKLFVKETNTFCEKVMSVKIITTEKACDYINIVMN